MLPVIKQNKPLVLRAFEINESFYYILINDILENIDEIKCVFSFSVFSL